MTQATLEHVQALIADAVPRRAKKHAKEGHIHNLSNHPGGVIGARATRDSVQGIVNGGVWVKVEYDDEDYDTNDAYDAVTNFNFTVPVAGRYFISGKVTLSFGTTAPTFSIAIFVGGVEISRGQRVANTGVATWTLKAVDILSLLLNDTVDIRVAHTGAGTENTTAVATENHFAIMRVGAAGGNTTGAHSLHSGLLSDDHTQYLLADGSRNLTGNLSVSAGVTIDGVDISDHVVAADPHTGYRLESADHTHQSTGLQAGQLDHGAAATAASLLDDDHTQYALLVGRNPAQDLSGGTLTTQQFILRANAIDATGVLTLDPTLSTLAGALSLTQLTTTHASQGIIMANGSAISAAGTANFGFLTSPANSVAINAPAGVVRITTNTISLGASTSIKDTAASSRILINDPGISTIFNEDGADIDHRFEGDTDVNLLFLDAGLDRVGIGTAAPSSKLEVNGLLTASGHIRMAANGEIQDVAGVAQIIVASAATEVTFPGTVVDILGALNVVLDTWILGNLQVDGTVTFSNPLSIGGITITTSTGITLFAAGSIKDSGGFARLTATAGAGNAVTLNDSAAVARVAVKSTTPFVALSSSTTLNTAETNAEAVLTLARAIGTSSANYDGFHARILRATGTSAYSGILAPMRASFGRTSNSALTDVRLFWANPDASITGAAALTNIQAFYGDPLTYGTNRYGYRQGSVAGGTIAYLLEQGAGPTLRLKDRGTGGWAAAANETPLWIEEGATPTLRQAKTFDPGAGGGNFVGGELVVILV